jgi:hypothetical protein
MLSIDGGHTKISEQLRAETEVDEMMT